MITRNELNIRHAKSEDAIEVCKLLKKLGLNQPANQEAIQHWQRLWNENPFYKTFKLEYFYGWVMEHNGKIVGFFGNIPRIYSLNYKLIPVAIASQWGVKKEYREYTDLLSEKFFNENPITLKLVTTAIKPTGRIFEKFNGKRVPNNELDNVYMVPIDLFKLIQHKYTNSLLKFFIAFLSYIIPWKWKFRTIKKNNAIREIKIETAENNLEEFLNRFMNQSKGLIATRNLETLKWFYIGGIRRLEKKFFIYEEKNIITGFASIIEEPIEGNSSIKRFKVIDVLAETNKVKKEIITELIRNSFEMKADVLEFHHCGLINKSEIPFFILTRKYKQFPAYYHSSDSELDLILNNQNSWNLMPFDGDTALS